MALFRLVISYGIAARQCLSSSCHIGVEVTLHKNGLVSLSGCSRFIPLCVRMKMPNIDDDVIFSTAAR